MYIMWDGPGFPTDLIVSFATTAGEPLPDVTLSYVDFFDDMAIYEFGGDPELWNWITGNPGEIIGFNVKVISI